MPGQISGIREGSSRFPLYDRSVDGFEKYWYPALRSRDVGAKARSIALFGRDIVFLRDAGRVYAFDDRCPHRGVPLSFGKREFPGTITCGYHGWTFDVKSGTLVAVLTDGPDSPICGKAHVRTYPVEERAGLVWIYNGTGTPPPVERDIPSEFLRSDAVIEGRITERAGDFRYAAENGFDEGHAKYLHRDAWMMFFARMPGFARVKVEPDEEQPWLTRNVTDVFFESQYPGVGSWPKRRFWKKARRGARLSIRMPGALRSNHVGKWMHFEWYVPAHAERHRYLQFVIARATGLRALAFRTYYWTFLRWLFHVQFNNQDARMVESMKTPPEQLYRPDISLVAWRHLCENALAAAESSAPAVLAAPEVLYAEQEGEQFRLAAERTEVSPNA